MKLCSLDVENLLSFDEFHLDLDEHLTVLVGPNGAGKSNVVRMIDFAATAITWADARFTRSPVAAVTQRVLDAYAQARHRSAGEGVPARVRVEFELTTNDERERIVAFVQAAILSTLLGELSGAGDPVRLAEWVARRVDATSLAPLLGRGTIHLGHAGVPDAVWEVACEFLHGGACGRRQQGASGPYGRRDGGVPAPGGSTVP